MNDFKFIKKGLTDFNVKADFFPLVYFQPSVVILILGIFSHTFPFQLCWK